MIRFLILIIIAAVAASCSSSETTAPAQIANRNAAPKNVAVHGSNSNSNAVIPVNTNIAANFPNRTENNGKTRDSTFDPKPGPDDSTFNAVMDKDGNFKEIREFKSHPKLLRVERKLIGAEERYTVFLRDGTSYRAPAGKMQNMRALAPENILDAIGQFRPAGGNSASTPPAKKEE